MGWNHRICGDCWLGDPEKFHWDENGDCHFRPPVQIKDIEPGVCCFCGNKTKLGIFVRADPKTLNCKCED